MTEAAAGHDTAHPVRHRNRAQRPTTTGLPPTKPTPLLLLLLLLLHVAATRAPHELPAAAALTVALTLPLLWRQRAPRAVFGAVAAAAFVQWLANVQLPSDAALLVALYTVAAHVGGRAALVAGAVVEGGALLACLRWATEGAFLAPFLALTATVVATVALGMNARTARAYLAALEERAARLEQHQDQQARLAVAEERTRIAREMHDIVTHNLSVMVALTDAAVQTQHRSPDRTTTAMLQVSETGRQALTDMRRSLGILRTDEPDAQRHPLPGIAQLDTLADRMRATGLPTRLDILGSHSHVPATAQLTVYRLVQEALTNTLQHTPAGTRADVRIQCSAATLTVDITDNGPHLPGSSTSSAPSGQGIPGMRERSAAYGGTLRAGPLPGGGWNVHTRLHLDGAAPA
ncbi:signal transduction histidine kinase [Streptomyces sp. 1114.5]|uniref:sensor histidine kinase n=1 Tax=Streptomyces sp. 1114.5 TaxID=1938830 RepID=UPI000EACA065|nr:histidine kinase [Streptomyces sp. 1114.5]RKT09600.1 signal transduction histidine kinase [Streptomyces sp. 1114.5]